jgi:hypothetical protein
LASLLPRDFWMACEIINIYFVTTKWIQDSHQKIRKPIIASVYTQQQNIGYTCGIPKTKTARHTA